MDSVFHFRNYIIKQPKLYSLIILHMSYTVRSFVNEVIKRNYSQQITCSSMINEKRKKNFTNSKTKICVNSIGFLVLIEHSNPHQTASFHHMFQLQTKPWCNSTSTRPQESRYFGRTKFPSASLQHIRTEQHTTPPK